MAPTPERYEGKAGFVTWRVRLRDPRRGKFTSETFATEHEARSFCAVVKAIGPAEAIARRVAQVGEDEAGAPKVDDLFAGYIEATTLRVRSDRTVADYRRDYRNWIQPAFGARRADTVTRGEVQRWVLAMTAGTARPGAKPLSAKSVADRHSILHGIYQWAVEDGQLAISPCLKTRLPRRTKSTPKGLRPAEWQALEPALRQIDADAADLAVFLLGTGWRFSEATALSAYGVEDYDDALYVTMSRVVRRNAAGQHLIVDDAKSEDSQRRVRLTATPAAVIRRRLETVADDGLVFTTRTGSQWHYANFANRAWKPAVKAANLTRKPTPHWLRHTQVFWLVLGGKASLAEIQKRVGHKHISTTIGVYGSMIEDVSTQALDVLEEMMGGAGPLAIEG